MSVLDWQHRFARTTMAWPAEAFVTRCLKAFGVITAFPNPRVKLPDKSAIAYRDLHALGKRGPRIFTANVVASIEDVQVETMRGDTSDLFNLTSQLL